MKFRFPISGIGQKNSTIRLVRNFTNWPLEACVDAVNSQMTFDLGMFKSSREWLEYSLQYTFPLVTIEWLSE